MEGVRNTTSPRQPRGTSACSGMFSCMTSEKAKKQQGWRVGHAVLESEDAMFL